MIFGDSSLTSGSYVLHLDMSTACDVISMLFHIFLWDQPLLLNRKAGGRKRTSNEARHSTQQSIAAKRTYLSVNIHTVRTVYLKSATTTDQWKM